MPYVIRPGKKHLGVAGVCSALLAFGAGSAQAATSTETSACAAPSFSQPFQYENDGNYYTPAPGQNPEGFQGTGWTLSGGAKIERTTLPNGKTGYVLDMPSGSRAVSPLICVTSGYPRARLMVRDVAGGDAVHFFVGHQGTNSQNNPQGGGDLHGHDSQWTLSDPLDMHPENVGGWQLAQITLVAGGDPNHPSEFQLSDMYVGGNSTRPVTPADTATCEVPSLSQPFRSENDSNYYMLAPGQSGENFQATGWTLSGGAKIEQTTLPDGKAGSVLNMPSGSSAVSPVICVTTAFPRARTMVRDVVGGDPVHFSVGYKGSNSWSNPQGGGDAHGHNSQWTLSDPLDMHPESVSGWQLVQITLVAGGDVHHPSDVQIDDLYIDPYSR